MKLKKIIIDNFKSIDHLEFDVKKHGGSYTTMFVGINEVGKSNILEAMSLYNKPKEECFFTDYNNQNNEEKDCVKVIFEYEIKDKNEFKEAFHERLVNSENVLKKIKFKEIRKILLLKKEKKEFEEKYEIVYTGLKPEEYSFQKLNKNPKDKVLYEFFHMKDENSQNEIESKDIQVYNLDEEVFQDILYDCINDTISNKELKVTLWKPEKEFLITNKIDLNKFKDTPSLNIPLRNIFSLSGFKTDKEIKTKIESIQDNNSLRRGLQSTLSDHTTKYFGKVWKHEIEVDVEITDSLNCNVHIKDKGRLNRNKFFNMTSRSDGFRQFVSLILSLSIENSVLNMKNRLILIDEPENHLHPSGIRDMRNEFLNIGQKNYVFLATHSCFMIDSKNKERNFIIKKDKKQNTKYKQITEESDVFDDEVLGEAFGINIYKDFLSPYKILVEGASDKKILQKAIKKFGNSDTILITNGFGSNIVSVATRLNLEEVEPLVILDDDEIGRNNKDKIIRIEGIFNTSNVNTLRDIENQIINHGTIEDTLGKGFIQSKLNEYLEMKYGTDFIALDLSEEEPFIDQIKIYLQREKPNEDIDQFLLEFKAKISDEFNPSNLEENFPLLKGLVEKIIYKLKGNDSE